MPTKLKISAKTLLHAIKVEKNPLKLNDGINLKNYLSLFVGCIFLMTRTIISPNIIRKNHHGQIIDRLINKIEYHGRR